MQKGDAPGQPLARRGVEQRDALAPERGEILIHARGPEAQVMQPLTALGEEARDSGVGARRLEQLDLAVAGGEQRGAHALIGDLRLADERQAERVAPEAIRLVEILHDDADVMDIGDHVRRHTLADGAAIFKGFRACAEPGRPVRLR